MQSVGQMSCITGGHSAAAKLFLGQLAAMDEKNWPLDAYRCSDCRILEFYDVSQ
jgi:hypothetical protein